ASVRYDTLTWRAYIKLHGNGQRYYTIEEYQRLPVLFWCLSGILQINMLVLKARLTRKKETKFIMAVTTNFDETNMTLFYKDLFE
ncbi:hypothetical protein V1478_000105, partial [Vespula squamosa]